LLGVALFQAPAYRQIADDPSATPSSGVIVLLVAALVGFVSGMTSDSLTVNGQTLLAGPTHGAVRALIEVCAGLVSWLVGSLVGSFVATTFFRGRTNTAEMLRVLGYTSVFRLLWIVPCGFVLSWLLSAVGTVIAMCEAAEFDTRMAVITAVVAWVIAFAVSGIVWLILTFVVVGLLVPMST
jgi:Yip1 domain